MMIKFKYTLALLVITSAVIFSCKKNEDDIPPPPPPRDRGVESIRAQEEIETFLKTHFYNYEEFEADPINFKLKFDTIAGDNASKTPLFEQVKSKKVVDFVDKNVTYTLYYLKVREGSGDQPHFCDYTFNTYEGRTLGLELFDSAVTPVKFDLVGDGSPGNSGIIRGYQQAIIEFKGAVGFVINPDGTLTYEDYGIGAVFIPSGLGYYQYPPSSTLKQYEQLIFTFELFDTEIADHDKDGIPSYMEDLNGNQDLTDDDTDGNGVPNYLDNDDDGDRRLTKDEIIIHPDGTLEFPDSNGNGTPDYLDPTI